MIGAVLGAMFIAFAIGGFARFALPGPDPMPPWLTIGIGLLAWAIGTGVTLGIGGKDAASWSVLASFFVAVALIVAYRRLIQKRPLWGPGAYRFPERGFGVDAYRERLKRAGIDPDKIGTPGFSAFQAATTPQAPAHAQAAPGEPTENPAHYLGLLEELHDSGVLDDQEYTDARMRLLERLRT